MSYLTVEDNEKGDRDECPEQDSQVGGKCHLVGEGHGGEGVDAGESRGGNEGRGKAGNGLGDVHLHGHGTRLDHGAGSTYNFDKINELESDQIRLDQGALTYNMHIIATILR